MNPSYSIRPVSPSAHLFEVVLHVPRPDPAGQAFWLPTWIPGSYLIREFSRHIVSVKAESGGRPLKVEKTAKQHWRVEAVTDPISLTYLVYAYDLSVRGAYLDQTRAFFNGPSVFLAVRGQENEPCVVHIHRPEGEEFRRWEVATTLAAISGEAADWLFQAGSYDELIDHPVEMGEFTRIQFDACGVPHEIVIAGRHHVDKKRLKKDVLAICETQIRFFCTSAPFKRYLFLTLAVGEGYGGLEHRDSTALICSRDDLPLSHENGLKSGYRQFLGLVSHEYFHSWNVKRIKPAAYAPYPLESEAYSRLLWAFEGITSYYDDLMLLRAGLIDERGYLDLLSQAMTSVQRTPGRQIQTLEEASLDAWIKYYRQDENSPNALVSYYVKGALVALALDLTIRQQSAGRKSLDDVMRALWLRFGRGFEQHGQGIKEGEWEAITQEVTGLDLTEFFDLALRSTRELPLADLLSRFGVESQLRAATGSTDKGGWQKEAPKPGISLGIKTVAEGGQVKLSHVFNNGPAQQAGLSAHDVLVAIDGLRVTPTNFETLLASRPAGNKREFWLFRRDELMRFQVLPEETPADTWGLRLQDAKGEQLLARNAWLHGRVDSVLP